MSYRELHPLHNIVMGVLPLKDPRFRYFGFARLQSDEFRAYVAAMGATADAYLSRTDGWFNCYATVTHW